MKTLILLLLALVLDQAFAEPVQCASSGAMCDGCQCCPDLKMCPNANNCPFKCPNDGAGPDPINPTPAPPGPVPDAGTGEHRVTFQNKCGFDIWVGSLNNPGKMLPHKGGWAMKQGSIYNITLPREWGGRFWGRTHCQWQSNGQFYCLTGDCGRQFECNGAGGEPPVTLAEFTFDGHAGLDYFDVSLVDGYNLPMQVTPLPGSYVPGSGICEQCGCKSDLNDICPSDLAQVSEGQVIACRSACAAFKTNQYCCHGEYNCSPHGSCGAGMKKCDPATWPVNYASIFKQACPTSYSYAYDDPSSTFTCTGNKYVHYDITFCP